MEAKKGNFMPFDVSEQLFFSAQRKEKSCGGRSTKKAMSVNEVKN